MVPIDERLATDLLRTGTRLLNNPTPRPVSDPAAPKFHKDAWAPGVELDNYTKRTPSDDGTYILVVEHKERIELIEQPPTPEEIEQRKRDQKRALMSGGVIAVGLVGVAGILQFLDRRQQRKPAPLEQRSGS